MTAQASPASPRYRSTPSAARSTPAPHPSREPHPAPPEGTPAPHQTSKAAPTAASLHQDPGDTPAHPTIWPPPENPDNSESPPASTAESCASTARHTAA